jgi:hypothetical protein
MKTPVFAPCDRIDAVQVLVQCIKSALKTIAHRQQLYPNNVPDLSYLSLEGKHTIRPMTTEMTQLGCTKVVLEPFSAVVL